MPGACRIRIAFLNCNIGHYRRIRIVTDNLEILYLVIIDALSMPLETHLRKFSGLTLKLLFRLVDVI